MGYCRCIDSNSYYYEMKLPTLFLLLLFASNVFADVTLEKLDEYDKFHRQYAVLSISNEIVLDDAKAFQDAMNTINTEGLHVKYDSVIIDNSIGGNIVSRNSSGSNLDATNSSSSINM